MHAAIRTQELNPGKLTRAVSQAVRALPARRRADRRDRQRPRYAPRLHPGRLRRRRGDGRRHLRDVRQRHSRLDQRRRADDRQVQGHARGAVGRRHGADLPRAAVLQVAAARCMGKGVRVQMIIDAPDDLYQLQSPPGLKEAVLHAQSLYEQTQGGPRHQQRRHRPQLPPRRVPGDEPVRHGRRARPLRPLGRRPAAHLPERGQRARQGRVIAPGDIVILPYCRYVAGPDPARDPRGPHRQHRRRRRRRR